MTYTSEHRAATVSLRQARGYLSSRRTSAPFGRYQFAVTVTEAYHHRRVAGEGRRVVDMRVNNLPNVVV